MYTTIIHPIRKALNLSCNEYIVLDQIWRLSKNEKYGNWCIASKDQLSNWLDLGRMTVFRSIDKLIQKGLIARDEKTGWLKTTDEWNEQMANSHDWVLGFKGKETQYFSGKVNDGTDSIKVIPEQYQSGTMDSTKVVLNNKSNNRDNNNTLPNGNGASSETYGNEEINKMIEALCQRIGVDAFVNSQKWTRIYGKHLFSLFAKLGKEEFLRRLDILLNDSFKRKRCNDLKYLYHELKGFIDPIKSLTLSL